MTLFKYKTTIQHINNTHITQYSDFCINNENFMQFLENFLFNNT